MPALLGYLLALTVFIGGGYAGLEWLSSPDDAATYQHSKATAPVADKQAKPKKSVPPADTTIQAENVAPNPSTQAGEAGHEAEAVDTGVAKIETQRSDVVPAGGCTPIGLTAGGQMVFPLQCREFLQAKRSAPVSAALDEDNAKASGQPDRTSGDVAAVVPRDEPPSANGAPVPESSLSNKAVESDDSTSTKALAQKEPAQIDSTPKEPAQKELVQRAPVEMADVAPTNAAKAAVRKFAGDNKTQKPEKLKPTPERSRLMKMTLLTIEFPDGHREQRLVPYRRLRNFQPRDDD